MLFFKSINEIPEDIYLETVLNDLVSEDDDLEDFIDEEDIEEEE
jgi:hypothetical protein